MTTKPQLDTAKAGEMLAAGATILEVAREFRVSPQAVYKAIKQGRIQRPEVVA
jgi:DNA invertase Pin-like site-specific DNA recombinase